MQEFIQRFGEHFQTAELLSSTVLRLLLAAFLGGAIGLERELSHKPAGLRTNLFICFGAAMFTILSEQMVAPGVGDRSRIASNIIPGIGFIGAGSILHSRGSVTGLTTAATLFVVAAIGMAAGGGFYLQAIFATMVILVALSALGWFETRFSLKPLVMTYEAVGEKADQLMSEVNQALEQEHRTMGSVNIGKTNGDYIVRFTIDATRKEHEGLLSRLRESTAFKRVAFLGEREEEE
ncbi:MAG: MgtC/SapB family protein [Acidobacteriales bacterium]|nr:MgtC/SapB family protein [Terriglobales bacterium]